MDLRIHGFADKFFFFLKQLLMLLFIIFGEFLNEFLMHQFY